jgi:hypothetical protein
MTATPTCEATTVPTFGVNVLRAVLAKGQAAHPELACRMQRAADLVAFRRIAPAVALSNLGRCWWVESSDGSTEYFVSQDLRGDYRRYACSCPDYQQRGGPCKHAIAVRLLQACERRAAQTDPEPAAAPVTATTLDPAAPIPFELTPLADRALEAPKPVPAA